MSEGINAKCKIVSNEIRDSVCSFIWSIQIGFDAENVCKQNNVDICLQNTIKVTIEYGSLKL